MLEPSVSIGWISGIRKPQLSFLRFDPFFSSIMIHLGMLNEITLMKLFMYFKNNRLSKRNISNSQTKLIRADKIITVATVCSEAVVLLFPVI